MKLKQRLNVVQRRLNDRPAVAGGTKVYWANELIRCPEHEDCSVELATGEHVGTVIRLAWSLDWRLREKP